VAQRIGGEVARRDADPASRALNADCTLCGRSTRRWATVRRIGVARENSLGCNADSLEHGWSRSCQEHESVVQRKPGKSF
jgi:hypothetical protein